MGKKIGVNALSKWSSLAGLVAVVLLVAGCSGPPASGDASEYVEPAWMAEYRADREEALATARECVAAKGFTLSSSKFAKLGDFGVSLPNPVPPELAEQVHKTLEECQPLTLTALDLEGSDSEYDRMLDTHACLVDKGYPLGTPQSRETWVELFEALDPNYTNPYSEIGDLIENGSMPELSNDELFELQMSCVAGLGGGAYYVFGPE